MNLSSFLSIFNQGHFSKVVLIANEAGFTPESNPVESYIKAAAFFKLGELQDSLSILEQLESSLDGNHEYLSLYGAACRRLGHLEKALTLLTKAKSLAPSDPAILNNYANVLIDLKKFDEAEVILKKLVDNNPHYTDAVENLKRISIEKSSLTISSASLNTSVSTTVTPSFLQINPSLLAFSDEEILEYGGFKRPENSINSTGVNSSIIEDVIPDIDLSNSCSSEYLLLAKKAFQEGNYEYCLEISTKVLYLSPSSFEIFDIAADALISLKRFADAEICILHYISLSTPSIKHYINLFSLSLIKKDPVLAKHYYDKALEFDPSHPKLPFLKDSLANFKSSHKASPSLFSFASCFYPESLNLVEK